MGMPHAADRWTAERVRELPDDGNRYELVSGQLVATPAPSGRHQAALSALFERLAPFVRATVPGAWLLWSPADLSFGEDEILQPDLFVALTRDGRAPERWADVLSLLLAIEVVSPRTARYDRTLKRLRYQRAGVAEYWIVDLDARLIERWRPDDARPEIMSGQLGWRPGGDVELVIDLAGWFNDVCGPAD
jgi:Uma2 family endonuclease